MEHGKLNSATCLARLGYPFTTESTHMAGAAFPAGLSFFFSLFFSTKNLYRELGSLRKECHSAIVSSAIWVVRKAPAGRVRQLLPLIIAQCTCTLGTRDSGSHDPIARVVHKLKRAEHKGTSFSAKNTTKTNLSCIHRLCTNINRQN